MSVFVQDWLDKQPPPPHACRRAADDTGVLCTGRPKAMVPHRLLDSVSDGLVGAAGGYVEIGGRILADIRFPQDLGEQ